MRKGMWILLLLSLLLPVLTQAEVSPWISFQGRLTESCCATPVADGNYSIAFTLYDVSSEGTGKWTETHDNVAVTGGLFHVLLGSVTPFGDLRFDQQLYLGITVGANPEMSVRYVMGSSPSALAIPDTVDHITLDQVEFLPRTDSPLEVPGAVFFDSDDNLIKYYNGSSWVTLGSADWAKVDNSLYPVDPLARVGIGTTNPAYPLDLYGNNNHSVLYVHGSGPVAEAIGVSLNLGDQIITEPRHTIGTSLYHNGLVGADVVWGGLASVTGMPFLIYSGAYGIIQDGSTAKAFAGLGNQMEGGLNCGIFAGADAPDWAGYFQGDVNISNSLVVNGPAIFNDDITLNGGTSLAGDNIYIDTLHTQNGEWDDTLVVNGQLKVTGELIADSIQAVGGLIRFDDSVFVDGSMTVNETLRVNGPSIFNNDVTFNQDITLNGGTSLAGDNIYIDTLHTQSGQWDDTLVVNGQLKVTGELIADSIQAVGGVIRFDDTVYVDGSMTITDSLRVLGPAVFSQDVIFLGTTSLAIPGPTGATGPQGIPGIVGATGPMGLVGPQGPTGLVGAQGPTGIQGIAGPVGATGPVGYSGPQGLMGYTGLEGPEGSQGPPGNRGLMGYTGPQGPQGYTGVTGATGPIGPVSVDGVSILGDGTVGNALHTNGVSGFTICVKDEASGLYYRLIWMNGLLVTTIGPAPTCP